MIKIETNVDIIEISTEVNGQFPDIMIYQEKWLKRMKKLDKAKKRYCQEVYEPRHSLEL